MTDPRFETCGRMSMGGWIGVYGEYTLQLVQGPYRVVKKKPLFGKLAPFEVLEGEKTRCWWLSGPGVDGERFVSREEAEVWLGIHLQKNASKESA